MADVNATDSAAAVDTTVVATQDSSVDATSSASDNATQTGETTTPPSDTPAEKSGDAGEGDASTDNVYTDFVLPEGMELDSTLLEQAIPVFKELGLSKESAQKLVDLRAKQIQDDIKSQAESFDQLKQDWQTAAKSDPEIGGDKYPESVATARLALSKVGTPELTKLLDEFGMGNHPEMIRLLARVGKFVKEDSPGNNGITPTQVKKDRTSILYPNS